MIVAAMLVATSVQAAGGLFDRLADLVGGEPTAYQPDGPTLATRGPILVPTAAEEPPVPAPDSAGSIEPVPDSEAIELYPCVVYTNKCAMHPCAVPVVVSVPDPCSVKHPFYWLVGDAPPDYCSTGCGCQPCARPMAYVQICVPPGCPVPEPCVHHHERWYTYNFCQYSVDVRLHRGEIEVVYHD